MSNSTSTNETNDHTQRPARITQSQSEKGGRHFICFPADSSEGCRIHPDYRSAPYYGWRPVGGFGRPFDAAKYVGESEWHNRDCPWVPTYTDDRALTRDELEAIVFALARVVDYTNTAIEYARVEQARRIARERADKLAASRRYEAACAAAIELAYSEARYRALAAVASCI